MHTPRKPDDRTPPRQKKLDLRRETLRRLDSLSEHELRQAIGGLRAAAYPSAATTGPSDTKGTC
jgi:hypothetical protein